MDSQPDTSATIVEVLSTVWRSKKLIGLTTVSVTILAIIVSLVLPKYYLSTATILPESSSRKLSALSGLSDLAALAGVSVGGEVSAAKLYPTIVRSEAVLSKVIYAQYTTSSSKEPFTLVQYWDFESDDREEEYEKTLRELRRELLVSIDGKTNVVTISIMTRDPELSAAIVNNVTRELDSFIRTKQVSSASEQRKWIEARLIEVKRDLERTENALKEFRQRNRRVADSPQLLLEQERLIREVTINSTVYTELKKQLEIAKIEEIKNMPLVNVMDAARPAVKKEKPNRTLIVASSFLLTLLGSVLWVISSTRYGGSVTSLLQNLRRDTR